MVEVVVKINHDEYLRWLNKPDWEYEFIEKYITIDVSCGYGYYGAYISGLDEVTYKRGSTCD